MATDMYSCCKCLWASHLKYVLELNFVGIFVVVVVHRYVVLYMTNPIQDSYFARSDILKYLPGCHISIELTGRQERALP